MGWNPFKSSYKTHVGLSAQRMIENPDIPRSLIDATAKYVLDAPNTGGMDMVDYSTVAIEMSMVTKTLRAYNLVRRKPQVLSETGVPKGIYSTFDESDLEDLIFDYLSDRHQTDTIKFDYLLYAELNYAHFAYSSLLISLGFNPTENTLQWTEDSPTMYLEDVVVHVQPANPEDPVDTLSGLSFTSGYTPFREENRARPFSPGSLLQDVEEGPAYITVYAVHKAEEVTSYTETITYTDEGDVDTIEQTELVITNSTYEDVSLQQVLVDTVDKRELVSEEGATKVFKVSKTKIYQSKYHKNLIFSDPAIADNYISPFEGYEEYQNLSDEAKELVDEIDGVESSAEDPLPVVQVAYHYIEGGSLKYNYATYSQPVLMSVLNQIQVLDPATFMPDLYFRHDTFFIYSAKNPEAINRTLPGDVVHGLLGKPYSERMAVYKDKAYAMYPLYRQQRKYANRLGIGYDDLSANMEEELDDLDKIKTLSLTFAISVKPTIKDEKEYLAAYADKLWNSFDYGKVFGTGFVPTVNESLNIPKEDFYVYDQDGGVIQFGDKISSKSLMVRKFVRAYIQGTLEEPIQIEFTAEPPIDKGVIKKDGIAGVMLKLVYGKTLVVKEQVTQDAYRITQLHGLSVSKQVSGNHSASYDDDDLILPLDIQLYRDLLRGFKNREQFIYKCLYIEAQTYQRQKVRFYEKGWFKILAVVVTVAINVIAPGTGVSLQAMLTAAIEATVVNIAISMAVKVLVPILGIDTSKIAMVLIGAVAVLSGIGPAGIGGNLTKYLTAFKITGAQMLHTVNAISKEVVGIYQAEMQELAEQHKERMEALKVQRENVAYRPDTSLNYYKDDSVTRIYAYTGDSSPDAFIARSLQSNPGLVAIEYCSMYVEYLTTLPTPQETLMQRP